MFVLCLIALATGLAPLRRERGLQGPHGGQCASRLKVQTANILLGDDLTPLITAPNAAAFQAAATAFVFRSIGQPNVNPGLDPVRRMTAIAQQIVADGVHVVGLQEVASWTITGFPQLDYLTVLVGVLQQLGADYRVAVRKPGFVAVGAIPTGGTDLVVRLEISDAILVRGDVPFSNPRSASYKDFIEFPSPLGTLPFKRQWVSVDISIAGAVPLRFFSTHLESVHLMGPISEGFRAKQARELAGEIIAAQADGFTTIAVGDWNSQVQDRFDSAQILTTSTGHRDAWAASGSGPGFTYGHDAALVLDQFKERIDFVTGSKGLYFSDVKTIDVAVTPQAGFSSPRFASDHRFVQATLHVPFRK